MFAPWVCTSKSPCVTAAALAEQRSTTTRSVKRFLRCEAARQRRTRRPAVTEDNRLGAARAPVLVGKTGAIPGHDRNQRVRPLCWLRWNLHLFTCCRSEADTQRKSVHDGRCEAASPCQDCKPAHEVIPGHLLS